jgi:hypothetical protein
MGENIRNSAKTIGTTALVVVPTLIAGQRSALVIVNTSTGGQAITLSWGTQTIALSGIVLYPGGSWSESEDNKFIPSKEQVWAVSSAASGTIAVHERVKTAGE